MENGELTLTKKKEGGKVNFDDGVYIDVPGVMPKPRHIQFYCKTATKGSEEACDFRLAKVRPLKDASKKVTWRAPGETKVEPVEAEAVDEAGVADETETQARLLADDAATLTNLSSGWQQHRNLEESEDSEPPKGFVCSVTIFEENERAQS